MSQLAKIDEQKALKLLLLDPRPSDQAIADQLGGVSREAVRQKRHKLAKQGLLEPKLTAISKPTKARKQGDGHRDIDISIYDAEIAGLEQQRTTISKRLVELTLQRDGLLALKELPQLKEERDKYKRGYENLLGSLQGDQLERLAKQGNIPGLILKNGKPSFTYHI